MKDTGQINLWDEEGIFAEEEDSIAIFLLDSEKIKNIRQHFNDKDFLIAYEGNIGHKSVAFIKHVSFEFGNVVRIYPKYLVKGYHVETFTGFDVTGDVVDDFFSPSRYFFEREKSNVKSEVDLVYNSEIADEWEIIFEKQRIIITLSYGDILYKGIASDLMLHPKLRVQFPKTADVQFVYRLYLAITRFFQIVRYDANFGKLQIELLHKDEEKISYNGKLIDYSASKQLVLKGLDEVEYVNYRKYIQRFLQFSADNANYSMKHYPEGVLRFWGRDYSPTDYMNLFSAFEGECRVKKDIYENVDATQIQSIKELSISILEEIPQNALKDEEKRFLSEAKNRITQIGTQFGQKRKIVNAFNVLRHAMNGSLKNILYRTKFVSEKSWNDSTISSIAQWLVDLRGTIVHGDSTSSFSDEDAQLIRFFEILIYSQTLKRIGLSDSDIERIIGALFGCNYVLVQEKYH